MDKIKKIGRGIIGFLWPEGSDIQTSAFIILAVCGTIVCVIAAINSLFVEPGFWDSLPYYFSRGEVITAACLPFLYLP